MLEYKRNFLERSPRFPYPLYGEGFKNLSINNLSYSLGKRLLLSKASINIVKNTISLIVGENGIGKSTFLKIINKQLSFMSGEVILDGRHLKEYSIKELASKIAYLPQKIVFNVSYSVYDLLRMSAYSNNNISEDIIENAVSFFGLEQLKDKLITQLSGGETQKVLLASTYIVGGELMLLDEPFSFLDPGQRSKVFDNILSLHEKKKRSFVIVVNSLEEMFMFKGVKNLNIYIIANQKINHFEDFNSSFLKGISDIFQIKIDRRK